jgi:hypothetical protein
VGWLPVSELHNPLLLPGWHYRQNVISYQQAEEKPQDMALLPSGA